MPPELLAPIQDLRPVVRAQRTRLIRVTLILLLMAAAIALLGIRAVVLNTTNERLATLLSVSEHEKARLAADCKSERTNNSESCLQSLQTAKLNLEYLQKAFKGFQDNTPEDVRRALDNMPAPLPLPIDPSQLEISCKGGKGLLTACSARALQILKTKSPSRTSGAWARAMKWLQWGCPDKVPSGRSYRSIDACELLGRAHFRGTPSNKTPDMNKALQYYEHACMLGSSLGCRRAGQIVYSGFKTLLENKVHNESKYHEARLFFASACAGGDGEGCYLFAAALSFDGDISEREVWDQVRRACVARYFAACSELARFPRPFRNRDDAIKARLADDDEAVD